MWELFRYDVTLHPVFLWAWILSTALLVYLAVYTACAGPRIVTVTVSAAPAIDEITSIGSIGDLEVFARFPATVFAKTADVAQTMLAVQVLAAISAAIKKAKEEERRGASGGATTHDLPRQRRRQRPTDTA